MAKSKTPKSNRPRARLPKGLQDNTAGDTRSRLDMLARIRDVYESYGFEPLETPAIEFSDALGKFLPDQDRPNEGVFSFEDEDGQWLSLRYDLTAPLARYVAENYQAIPKPFRRYAFGPVWRNEKPGPGRFRQFMQFDADTVGTDNPAADAEICMLAADTLERLGIKRGDYVIKISHRGLLDGVLEQIGLAGEESTARKLTVMRAIDKMDRLGPEGVRALLGKERIDESGDVTPGANLKADQIDEVMHFLTTRLEQPELGMSTSRPHGEPTKTYERALGELLDIQRLCRKAGYEVDQIRVDQTVVRGLEYYTGPVFEAELTFEIKNDDGQTVRFGSVGGGGRYDDLVARFTGQRVPATGFSIGVSRLQAALSALNTNTNQAGTGPVIVLVMDKEETPHYQQMAQTLRREGIRAETYVGTAGMKAQMKYADKRNAPCVVIQGGDEREKGEVQIKDLIEGAKAAAAIADAKEWRESRPAQFSVPETNLVDAVKRVIASQQQNA